MEDRRVLASYMVDTALDVVAEDGMISLREAIQAANTNAAVNADTIAGEAGPGVTDTITFADGLSTITLGSELTISDSLSISLGDSASQTISGADAARIFSVNGGADAGVATTVSINGLTLSDGLAERGGAIFVSSGQSLSLDMVALTGNTATGDDATDGGGAIYNDGGSVTIVDSTITANVASGTSGSGGGLFNAGTISITDTEISGNTANRAGGGIEVIGGSMTTLAGVTLENNNAGISPAVAAPGNGGGIHVGGNGVVTVTGGSVVNNQAVEGGGLWNSAAGSLTIDGTTISGNTAVAGGGVYNDAAAPLADQTFALDFQALNDSGVTGTGMVIVSSPTETTRTVRVVIDAEGLEDLSGINGAVHVAHIHGQFAGNATRPILEQGDGPFFDGAGGAANGFPPTASLPPTLAGDDGRTIEDGFLDFLEGRPQYGPVVLNLTSTQLRDAEGGSNPPDGTPPLTHFLNLLTAGEIDAAALFPNGTEFNLDTTYTFDLTNADEARQFNNIAPVGLREIVLHGKTVQTSISDAIDAAAMGVAPAGVPLGNGMSFRVTAPVAVSVITPVSGSVTITGATITGNTATGDDASEGGGGIHNSGSLTVSDSDITNNTAGGTAGSGGGVWNAGLASITNTEISGNTANRAGGGIEATDTSTTTLISVNLDTNTAGPDGSAAPGNGGGLHISGGGTATISGGTVNGNTAASEGGGLWNGSGVMTVSGTMISGNTASGNDADNGGGGIFNDGGTLLANDAEITNNVADGSSGSGGGVLNQGMATFTNTIISGNTANRAGGGIELTAASGAGLIGVVLSGNVAGPAGAAAPGNGGGVHITGDGCIKLTETTVGGNSAANEGGGLWNSAAGSIEVIRSTITTNTSGDGGGIFNDGDAGNVSVTNSTIAGNTATGSGGGIASEGASVTLVSVTIADNSAATGGGVAFTGGSVSATNTIISRNTASTDTNVSGTIVDNGNNLVNVDAGLGSLADNGGPTQTISLLAGSAALDAGITAGLATDQRGVVRPQGPAADIGAYESDLAAPNPATISIAATDADKAEGNIGSTTFTFTVSRASSTVGPTTVDFAIAGNGTDPANAADFLGGVFPTGTVSFADGETSKPIVISVLGDTGFESDESFAVTLSNPSGGANITAALATGTIRNDDLSPVATLSIVATNANRDEGDTSTTPFIFTVNRTGDTTGTTTVNYAVTSSGSNAADASDFGGTLPTGTVMFVPGETSKLITINVSGDNTIEQDESFTVTLATASGNAVIATPAAVGLIQDDDFVMQENRIFVPTLVARQHVIPGDSIPTAIIFQAVADTVVTVTPVATASVTETIRIVDGNTNPISSFVNGVTTATVSAGGLYAVIFEPQSTNRIYSIQSSAGFDALSSSPSTNIFQPTDTNVDGGTTALDALVIINELGRQSVSGEGEQAASIAGIGAFLDVNRDERVSALDALIVINYLARQSNSVALSQSEGEQIAPLQTFDTQVNDDRLTREIETVDILFGQEETPLLFSSSTDDAVNDAASFGPAIRANASDAALSELSETENLFGGIELLSSAIAAE